MHLSIAHMMFEILHCRHLRIGRFIRFSLLTDGGQQSIPLLYEGMGLHHQHETDMIGHSLTIALKDMSEIHKGICHLARRIHHPRLLSLAEEALQAFADNRPTDIEYEIRDIRLILAHQADRLIEQRVHGLTSDEHGALGLEEHPCDMTQRGWRHIGSHRLDQTFLRQFGNSILKEWFGDGHIDMYRTSPTLSGSNQSLVD